MLGGELSADRGQFLLRRQLGEDLARLQFRQRALDHGAQPGIVARAGKQRRHGVAVLGDAARLGEMIHQRADIAIDRQSRVADRMHDQDAVLADGKLVNEAGATQDHACL